MAIVNPKINVYAQEIKKVLKSSSIGTKFNTTFSIVFISIIIQHNISQHQGQFQFSNLTHVCGKQKTKQNHNDSNILYPELSFLLSSTTPLSTLEKQSQNHMTIINVFQSNDQNIVVLVEGMFHSILHFVYHVIVFNFYLRKIVLQEVAEGGGIIFQRELI